MEAAQTRLQKPEVAGEEDLHLAQRRQTAATVAISKYGDKRRVPLVPVIHLCPKTGVVPAGYV